MLYMLFGNRGRMPSDISDDSVVSKDESGCPFNVRAIASLSYCYLFALVDVDAGGGNCQALCSTVETSRATSAMVTAPSPLRSPVSSGLSDRT